MKKSPYLFIVLLFISFLTGGTGSNVSSRKPWLDIKASELISRQQLPERKAINVSLHIYLFQIRTDKLAQIQEQFSQPYTLPVKYNDPCAFWENGIIGCAGDRTSWQKVAALLTQSQPETKKHISLLIDENAAQDIVVTQVPRPVSIVYRSGSTIAGIGFDTGTVILRIKVNSLIGLRQACRLDVTPVYRTDAARQKAKKILVRRENREFIFESAAFNVRLQPGQFVLLVPAEKQTDQAESQTISNILFYPQTTKNTANLCLIACNLINNPL
jgi:hypothetical protein